MILEMLAQFAPVILIVVFLLGMVIGLPITWALGITTVVTVAIDPGITFAVVGQKLFSSADNFAMLAVPGFFLAGDIMTAGGLSKKLVEFADSLVCRFCRYALRLDTGRAVYCYNDSMYVFCRHFRFLCRNHSGHRRHHVSGNG